MRLASAVLVALVLVDSAQAQDATRLHSARTFRCSFEVMASADMRSASPEVSVRRESFELVFDQINVEAGTGRMIGNQGGEDVRVIGTTEGITIIEVLGSGFLQVTVIYLAQNADRRFRAVHSRHTALFGGEPVPSQYYGSCAAML
jgi:hypothetical protein